MCCTDISCGVFAVHFIKERFNTSKCILDRNLMTVTHNKKYFQKLNESILINFEATRTLGNRKHPTFQFKYLTIYVLSNRKLTTRLLFRRETLY